MTTIDPEASVASLVLDHPQLAPLLAHLDLDFCCHGDVALTEACAARGLDLETTVRLLEAQAAAAAAQEPEHGYDARAASTADLCDHIVAAHHEPLRLELPRLAETAARVVRAHGPDDPRLERLADALHRLSCALLTHFDLEERVLFPACIAVESGGQLDEPVLLEELRDDHSGVGDALRDLRVLADDYAADRARCGTHRALLDGLSALERDLHLHIHEENNVLFPRVRGRLAA